MNECTCISFKIIISKCSHVGFIVKFVCLFVAGGVSVVVLLVVVQLKIIANTQ